MTYNLKRITELNKYLLRNYCHPDCIAVDATTGNGNDTLFLAKHCRFVYGFDIQRIAIERTEARLKENGVENYELFCDTFANMAEYVNEKPDIITFNLGYLPNGDPSITTKTEETIKAINSALRILNDKGVMTLCLYWGHEEGKREREGVIELARQLDSHQYHVSYISLINQLDCPPEIIMINK